MRRMLLAGALALISAGCEDPSVSSPETFAGFDCTDDCSGHQVGYDWAEDNDITDSDDCGGNSDSFIEGCVAYAEERANDETPEEGPDIGLF